MKRISSLLRYASILISLILGILIGTLIMFFNKTNVNLTQILGPLATLFVGFSIPLITTYIFQRPKLSVEISSIQRKISENNKIYIDNYSEFSVLKENTISPRRRRYLSQGDFEFDFVKGLSLLELDELIKMTKKELNDLPQALEKRKSTLEKVQSINVEDFTVYDAERLNQPLLDEVEFERSEFSDSKSEILKQFTVKYKEQFDEVEKRFNQLNSSMPSIERKLEQLKDEITAQRSFFSISTTLMNSGRLNTSIRKPALLRVYIGQGNYIDLKLIMKDFENKSDINFQSTKIVEFESSEISALPEDDRSLINTYWGQSVSANLYLEDIYSSIHSSNTISFAEGLYQKLIYDELAIAAGNKRPKA